MLSPPAEAPELTLDTGEARVIGRELARNTEVAALREAANQQTRISEVAQVHRALLERALMNVDMAEQTYDDLFLSAEAVIQQLQTQREARFDPRIRVAHIPSAGMQAGDDMYVSPDVASVQTSADAASEVSDHEARHLRQNWQQMVQTPDSRMVTYLETTHADPTVQRFLKLDPVCYFEADAMLEAGYDHTVDWYRTEYLEPALEVANYIDGCTYRGGVVSGLTLVRSVAISGRIDLLHEVILAAYEQKQAQTQVESERPTESATTSDAFVLAA